MIIPTQKANCIIAENIGKLCRSVKNKDKSFIKILIENNIISSKNEIEESTKTLYKLLLK